MVFLPCAVSSTWTWVNQLLTLVQWLGWYRTTTYQHFKTLSHLGHLCGICYDIAKQYWAAWGFFFWKRRVSPSFLGVFLDCFRLFLVGLWFLVVFVCFVLEDTWLFALTYSPTCGNSQSKTICFDDRLSLERARHELKKKGLSSKVSLDFAGLGSPCSWAPLLFLLLDVALLHRQPLHLWDGQTHLAVDESLVLLQRPLPSSSEERLGCFLKALHSLLPHFSFLHVLLLSPKFLLGGYCMHWGWLFAMLTQWEPLTVSLAHALVLCFTRFHQVLGWSSCLALSNQQACVRPYCFTGRPRPIGTDLVRLARKFLLKYESRSTFHYPEPSPSIIAF